MRGEAYTGQGNKGSFHTLILAPHGGIEPPVHLLEEQHSRAQAIQISNALRTSIDTNVEQTDKECCSTEFSTHNFLKNSLIRGMEVSSCLGCSNHKIVELKILREMRKARTKKNPWIIGKLTSAYSGICLTGSHERWS